MPESGSERREGGHGVSKTAMLLGAAGLFLFIVGVKRKHRLDAERVVDLDAPASAPRGKDRARGG